MGKVSLRVPSAKNQLPNTSPTRMVSASINIIQNNKHRLSIIAYLSYVVLSTYRVFFVCHYARDVCSSLSAVVYQ